MLDRDVLDERASATKRVPSASTRFACGGRRVAAELAIGQPLAVEARAAVRREPRIEIQHRGIAAQRARIGMRSGPDSSMPDDLHAVVVECAAFGRRLPPRSACAGGLAHACFDDREFVRVEARASCACQASFRLVRIALGPVVPRQAARAHRHRIGEDIVEQPVIAAFGWRAIGQDRNACGGCAWVFRCARL